MKKILLALILLSVVITSCSSSNGVIVGKDETFHDIDVKLDNGEIINVSVSLEQFYFEDYEIGSPVSVSCFINYCTVD